MLSTSQKNILPPSSGYLSKTEAAHSSKTLVTSTTQHDVTYQKILLFISKHIIKIRDVSPMFHFETNQELYTV
jgi:hypothetical protein